MMKREEAYWPLILFLALIKFVLPLFLQSPVYELQRDEYLYYEQGQHLALGYLENPPLLSWLGSISSLLGGSPAWIKIWPCLFGASTLIITCLITAELGGKLFAQFIAGLGIITGAFMRVHFLFQPNILDIFFWTLAIYFLIRYIHSKNENYIYGITICLALGWWSKYSVLFMIAAIVIGLVASPHRVVFIKRKTWFAVLAALLLIAPNIAWQYSNNWPLIHHMDELRETQLKYINRGDFIKEQILLLFPVVFIWIAGLIWLLKNPSFRILSIIYVAVITLLMFGSGKGYYALGVYPMLVAAGSVVAEKWTLRRYWLKFTIPALIILLTFPLIPLLLPIWKPEKLAHFYEKNGIGKTGLLKWEDQQEHPLPQDFADMLGWKELAAKTEKFYENLPDSVRNHTIIYASNYGQAGAIKFYARQKEFADRVISDNGSFTLWVPAGLSFRNILFIAEDDPKQYKIFQHFERDTVADSLTSFYARERGNQLVFFENIDPTGLQLIQQEFSDMKQQFKRQ